MALTSSVPGVGVSLGGSNLYREWGEVLTSMGGGSSNLYRALREVVLISIGGGEVLTCTEHKGEVLLIYTEWGRV